MANYLPFILIGGVAAAYMMKRKKQKIAPSGPVCEKASGDHNGWKYKIVGSHTEEGNQCHATVFDPQGKAHVIGSIALPSENAIVAAKTYIDEQIEKGG